MLWTIFLSAEKKCRGYWIEYRNNILEVWYFLLTVSGHQAYISRCLRLVNIRNGIYDCIVVRAYTCCHLSRYIISVVFCSLIPSVVSVSLNSQYNWVSPWFWLRPLHYRTSDQDFVNGEQVYYLRLSLYPETHGVTRRNYSFGIINFSCNICKVVINILLPSAISP